MLTTILKISFFLIVSLWALLALLMHGTRFWVKNFSLIYVKDINLILEAYRTKSKNIDYPVVLRSSESPLSIEIDQLVERDHFIDKDRMYYKISIFTTTHSGERVDLQCFKTTLLTPQTNPNPFLEIKGPWRNEALNIIKSNKKEAQNILRKTGSESIYKEELEMKERKEIYLKTVKGE